LDEILDEIGAFGQTKNDILGNIFLVSLVSGHELVCSTIQLGLLQLAYDTRRRAARRQAETAAAAAVNRGTPPNGDVVFTDTAPLVNYSILVQLH